MGYEIQQSSTASTNELIFWLFDSSDHVTGLTGKAGSVVVKLRKCNGTGAAPAGAITEVDATNDPGKYRIAPNATDSNTLGPLTIYAKDAASDPYDDMFFVTVRNPYDVVRNGMTSLPNAVAEASGGIVTNGTGTGQISVAGGRAKADVSYWNAAAIAAPDTAGYPKVTVKSGGGTGELDVTSGVVKSNLSQILGTALTQTFSLATGFKTFFDVLTARLTCASYDQGGDVWERLGSPAGLSHAADIAAVKTDTGNLITRIPAALFSGITSLAQWLGLIACKQTGDTTARTEIRATGAGSGTFDETTDSQEAARDRGDAAWTTATGFATATALQTVDDELAAAKAVVDAIKVKTDYLPSATAGAANGVAIVGSAMSIPDAHLTSAKFSVGTLASNPTGFLEQVKFICRKLWFGKAVVTRTSTAPTTATESVYDTDGTTLLGSRTVTDNGVTATANPPS